MKGIDNMHQPLMKEILAYMQASGKTPCLNGSLDVEMNRIPFHLHACDGKAILKFKSWSEALAFFTAMKKHVSAAPSIMSDIRHFLHAIGLTIYLQNSKFGIMGPQAGLILPGLLLAAIRFNGKQA